MDTPRHIVDAAVRALRSGRTHYAASRGTPELRSAIADTCRASGLRRDPGSEILVAGAAKLALSLALDAVVDPGDEVLVLGPSWVSYAPLVRLRGGIPVEIPLRPDDYRLTADALRAARGSKTVALIVNTPCNPTGRVLDHVETMAIAEVARESDWTVISDEVYSRLVLDGEHRSPAMDAPERTLVVDGLSKGFAMTGWRLGWLHGPADLVAAAALVYEHTVSCAPTFIQDAAVAALTDSESAAAVGAMADTYRRRRSQVLGAMAGCTAVRLNVPQGGFYLFPDVSETGANGSEFSDSFLARADVAVLPGVAFGDNFVNHVRLSLATPDDILLEGVRQLRKHALSLAAETSARRRDSPRFG